MISARSALVAGVIIISAAALSPAVAAAAPAAQNTAAPQQTGLRPVCGGLLARLGCEVEVATTNGTAAPMVTGSGPLGWGATDLQKAHQIPTLGTRSGTIAVIDVGADPQLESDLGVYRAQYGMPACTTANGCFQQLDYQGGPALPPATSADDKAIDEEIAFETSLDVEMASAACPACHLTEIQIPDSAVPSTPPPGQPSNFDGYAQAFATATQTAVAHGASAVSMSYGLPGDAAMLQGSIANGLDHPGVAITASAGDGGFQGDAYLWPQALPTVTSVGGTELVEQSGLYVEGAWSQTGSGCTPTASAPAGQPAKVSGYCAGGRSSTDVSAVADNVAVYDTYTPATGEQLGWLVAAGTSAASPFIAGVYAAAGHLGAVHGPNTLYQAPSFAFHDVTSGGNASIGDASGDCLPVNAALSGSTTTFAGPLCAAQSGWDGPTGLGSPRGLLGF
ncbi:MAG TPA: S8 family serine peptidase [Pseudonocardiaceae bacterium]|jgi:subtilase family serine protease|nr:S8 family serine peptidase [Pseudonocardiaceae bacterium]